MTSASRIAATTLLAALVSLPAAAQTELTEKFSKTSHLDQGGTFDLTNINGNIAITGGTGRDVTIDAIKRVQRPNANAARSIMQLIDIQVTEQANRIEVRTVFPRPRNFPGSVDYTISVPEDASVTLKTISGAIRATNVKGELRADAVAGAIAVTGARKLEALKCVTGNVDIVDASADDPVMASTYSGNITVRGLKGRALQVTSVSGNIRLDDAQVDRLTVRTVQGNLEFNGDLARSGRYEFTSHSGDIRLALSGNTGFEVVANTLSGSVHSDFAVVNERGGRGQVPPPQAQVIRGAVGDASAMLALRAFSGNISITRR
jgi:hypothetical protein